MSDKITLHGHEIDLPRGTKVFAGQIPAPHDGFGLIFTDAAGAKTHLCLSREAFDAVAMLHAWLVDIPVAHHKLICDIQGAIDPGSQWVQTNPLEVIPSAVETTAEPRFCAHPPRYRLSRNDGRVGCGACGSISLPADRTWCRECVPRVTLTDGTVLHEQGCSQAKTSTESTNEKGRPE